MLPLPQGPKHFYKCLTVVVVIGLHVFVVWMLSHLIEPYTFKATLKVDALKVSFVSLAPAKKPSVEKTESQPKNSVTPQSTLNSSVSHAPDQPKNSPTNVQTLASKTATKEVVQNNLNDKQQAQPKTTLNNPKVDEWNAIMRKYQEGIEGTKPEEVWVFFKPVE